MKKITVISFLFALFTACHSTKPVMKESPVANNYQEIKGFFSDKSKEPQLDKYPMYPDGIKGIMYDIGRNFNYPPAARKKKAQGKVIVKFLINEKGEVAKAEVLKSEAEILNDEAIRLVMNLRKFRPGYKDGKPVKVSFNIPIVFQLDDD